MTTNVTCKTCTHNRASWVSRTFGNGIWWSCDLKYYEPKYNPVDGKTSTGYYVDCSVARRVDSICGEDGANWKPRNKKDLFIYLKRI
jgi:hypothetical protein